MTTKETIEINSKINEMHAIEFAKWCLRNIKKSPSGGKKYVFKHQNKVISDEYTIDVIYKTFLSNKIK